MAQTSGSSPLTIFVVWLAVGSSRKDMPPPEPNLSDAFTRLYTASGCKITRKIRLERANVGSYRELQSAVLVVGSQKHGFMDLPYRSPSPHTSFQILRWGNKCPTSSRHPLRPCESAQWPLPIPGGTYPKRAFRYCFRDPRDRPAGRRRREPARFR